MTAVLIGSTGSLGAYLLHKLLCRPETVISKVHCLDWRINAAKYQEASHRTRGLMTGFDRVEFLSVYIRSPQLGLDRGNYQRLAEETSFIIHTHVVVGLTY